MKNALFILLTIAGNPLLGQSTVGKLLLDEIRKVDSIFFQSLNNCDLKTYESFLTEDFEFYHDREGLTKSKDRELKSMAVTCGEQRQRQTLRRELIRESFEVFPINNFGAVETGRHQFYLVINDEQEKVIEEAKFTNIWEHQAGTWKLSRVVSYDHQPKSVAQLSNNILRQFVGKYQMSAEKTIIISMGTKLLKAQDGEWTADLYPESASKFYLDYGNVQFEFIEGQTGLFNKLVIYENGNQVEQGTRKN